jgi:hypothetical protein
MGSSKPPEIPPPRDLSRPIREEFTDGYVDWSGFDDDGPVDGTAEVTGAVVDGDTLLVNLEYEPFEYIVSMKKGGNDWKGSLRDQRRMLVPVPEPDAQARFVRAVAPLDARTEHNRRESLQLARVRDALLPKLMSGELRVRDAERVVGAAT